MCSCVGGRKFSTPLYKCQAAGLLDYIVGLCSVLEETTKLPKWLVPFCVPTSSEWEFLLFHPLQALAVISVAELSHSNRCVVASHFLNLHSTDDIRCRASLYLLFTICIYSFMWCQLMPLVVLKNRLYVALLPSFKRFLLYILNNSSFSYVSLAYIFPSFGLSSPSLESVFYSAEVINFNKVQSINNLFYRPHLWCSISEVIDIPKVI